MLKTLDTKKPDTKREHRCPTWCTNRIWTTGWYWEMYQEWTRCTPNWSTTQCGRARHCTIERPVLVWRIPPPIRWNSQCWAESLQTTWPSVVGTRWRCVAKAVQWWTFFRWTRNSWCWMIRRNFGCGCPWQWGQQWLCWQDVTAWLVEGWRRNGWVCWFWATTFSCFDVLILLDKTIHPLVILSVVSCCR